MSIVTRTRPEVKFPRPAAKPARPFAAGLFRSTPVDRVDYTAADAAWWAAESARLEAARLDRHYDELAEEARLADLLARGIIFA